MLEEILAEDTESQTAVLADVGVSDGEEDLADHLEHLVELLLFSCCQLGPVQVEQVDVEDAQHVFGVV